MSNFTTIFSELIYPDCVHISLWNSL